MKLSDLPGLRHIRDSYMERVRSELPPTSKADELEEINVVRRENSERAKVAMSLAAEEVVRARKARRNGVD